MLKGSYRLYLDKLYTCEKKKNLPLQFNIFLHKKSLNITEIKGNFTFHTPFDNTLDVSTLSSKT